MPALHWQVPEAQCPWCGWLENMTIPIARWADGTQLDRTIAIEDVNRAFLHFDAGTPYVWWNDTISGNAVLFTLYGPDRRPSEFFLASIRSRAGSDVPYFERFPELGGMPEANIPYLAWLLRKRLGLHTVDHAQAPFFLTERLQLAPKQMLVDAETGEFYVGIDEWASAIAEEPVQVFLKDDMAKLLGETDIIMLPHHEFVSASKP